MGYLLFALLGLLIGALINILADDLPARRRPRQPRCPACGDVYRPALWFGTVRRLGQRCPGCNAPERWRPLVVEVGMAVVYGLLWSQYRHETAELLAACFYFAVFALILVTDLEHRLILHAVTVPSIALALVATSLTASPARALLGAAAGFVVFFVIYLVGGLAYGAGAMGFGDVTLATLIGAAVGFPHVILALLAGILAGGLITLLLLLTRIRRLRSKVPYGPFLLIGAVVTLLWGDQIIAWYLG